MAGTKLEMLGSLQQFMIAMLSKASETPQLEGSRTIFGGKVVQVLELSQEQAGLTADKQDVTRQFQEALADAQRMATAMRAALKSHYGPDSDRLVEFGIQPFRYKSRKRTEPEPLPPPIEAVADKQ